MINKKVLIGFVISCAIMVQSQLASAFVLRHIDIEGAMRIRKDTVLTYIPVKPGDNIDTAQTQSILDALYKTNFFEDIRLKRRGDDLVIHVTERPVIGNLTLSGNKLIKDKDLTKSLKQNGISTGMVYDKFKVNGIKVALEDQYHRLGRYNAHVTISTHLQERNRVGIDIQVFEGEITRITKIRIIGSHCFSENELLKRFKLTRKRLWTRFTHGDEYSREKLDQDLASLRDFYLDRGYLYFKVVSNQVEITPDKKDVYITINVSEGDIYRLNDYHIQGELLHRDTEIVKLVSLKKGEPFSRKDLMTAQKDLGTYFANCGYANAVININPKMDEAHRTVTIIFDINPGKPVYVREISFEGNSKTEDEVLRRSMLQFESSIYNQQKIDESKRRLANLGYLENVEYRVDPVPEHPDLVDLTYHVNEASTATATAQVGYSDSVGILYGAGLKQPNFLGSGSSLNLNFDKNDACRNLSMAYFNPYYTMSGIGRGFDIFSKQTTPSRVGISNYSTDSFGGNLSYSIPISVYDHISMGLGYRHLKLYTSDKSSNEILSFVKNEGSEFDEFTGNASWQHSSFDRAIYPTSGFMSVFGLQFGIPVMNNSLDYYKLSHTTSFYYPFNPCWVFHTRTRIGYGDGYGRTNDLPFFLNYYGGGIDTIRGVRDNSLGPRDSRGKPLGGNVMLVGGVSLIFPNFISEHVRTSLFVDAGNIYQSRLDLTDINFTGGLQIEWLSPFGPLQFSFAHPLNHVSGRDTKVFQFTIGTSL